MKGERGWPDGPWIVATSCSWRRIVQEHGHLRVAVPTIDLDGHPNLDASMETLHLMSAAPDLYEALELFMALDPSFGTAAERHLDAMITEGSEAAPMARAVKAARSALRKARGKS